MNLSIIIIRIGGKNESRISERKKKATSLNLILNTIVAVACKWYRTFNNPIAFIVTQRGKNANRTDTTREYVPNI